jgi:hypothetical protein
MSESPTGGRGANKLGSSKVIKGSKKLSAMTKLVPLEGDVMYLICWHSLIVISKMIHLTSFCS